MSARQVDIIDVNASNGFIRNRARLDLELRLMAGEPVQTAALAVGIGKSSAYRFRDALRERLASEGKRLPKPKFPGRPGPRGDVPTGATSAPVPRIPKQPEKRPLTFEEQLARVASGAGLVRKFTPPSIAPQMTLGGVGSGML